MNTGPMSHPGNNPPDSPDRLNPCSVCGGCGYVVETWDRSQGQPRIFVRVMACERCNPPRRSLGPGIPRTRHETWNHPHPAGAGPALPPLHVECPGCVGWGFTDLDGAKPCPTCDGRGRIPTDAGQAILNFIELMRQATDWPEPEDHP